MLKKGRNYIFIALIITALAFIALFYYSYKKRSLTTPGIQTACTLEAKLCPDGTAVGREGPNCEFAPCPTQTNVSPAISEYSQECGVCGEEGLHNLEGKTCAPGLECVSSDGEMVTSGSFCIKPGGSINECLDNLIQ